MGLLPQIDYSFVSLQSKFKAPSPPPLPSACSLPLLSPRSHLASSSSWASASDLRYRFVRRSRSSHPSVAKENAGVGAGVGVGADAGNADADAGVDVGGGAVLGGGGAGGGGDADAGDISTSSPSSATDVRGRDVVQGVRRRAVLPRVDHVGLQRAALHVNAVVDHRLEEARLHVNVDAHGIRKGVFPGERHIRLDNRHQTRLLADERVAGKILGGE